MVAAVEDLKGRDFTRVADWSGPELERVLDLADELKDKQKRREPHQLLPGRSLGMIFQKPSTRTRVSFEVGIVQLGGRAFTSPPAIYNSAAARRSKTPRRFCPATSTRS